MSRSAFMAVVVFTAVAAGVSTPTRAEPNPRRFAVVIGSNRAAGERAPLRYAHRDAQAMASALVSVADFPAGAWVTAMILDTSVGRQDAVRAVLSRMTDTPGPTHDAPHQTYNSHPVTGKRNVAEW